MKIGIVNMFYYPTFGGVEVVMQELAERYVKQGHEVHVFCCDSDKYKRIKQKYEIHNGVHIHRSRYWFRLSLSTFIWPGLILQLRKHKLDIVHSHVSGHLYILLTGIMARLKKIPHIHTTHCPWTDAFRPWILKPFLFFNDKILNKLSFNLCTKIIAITPWEIPILTKWTSEDKIKVLPNGMDNILFKKVKNNKFKIKYGLKGKLVLYFGRLNPTKGPDKLAQAAVELLKTEKNLCFAFVGPDEGMMDKVKEIVKNQPQIKVTGSIRGKDKVAQMFQAAEVYVLPSYREGLPLTLFEAYASGLPVIASPVNGIPYELKEGINGFLVNYGDIEGLKKKIIEVLNNKKLANQFKKNNLKKAKNFTWDHIAKETFEEYKKLTDQLLISTRIF